MITISPRLFRKGWQTLSIDNEICNWIGTAIDNGISIGISNEIRDNKGYHKPNCQPELCKHVELGIGRGQGRDPEIFLKVIKEFCSFFTQNP